MVSSATLQPQNQRIRLDACPFPCYIMELAEKAPENMREMLLRVFVLAEELDRRFIVEKELFGWIQHLPLHLIPLQIQDIFEKGSETVDFFIQLLSQNEGVVHGVEELVRLVDLFTQAMSRENFVHKFSLRKIPSFFQGGEEYLEDFLQKSSKYSSCRIAHLATAAIGSYAESEKPAGVYNSELSIAGYCQVSIFQAVSGTAFECSRLFGWKLPEEKGEGLKNCIVRKMNECGMDMVHYSHLSCILEKFFSEAVVSSNSLQEIDFFFYLLSKLRNKAGMFFFLLVTQPSSYSSNSIEWGRVLQVLQLFCQLCDMKKIGDEGIAIAQELYGGSISLEKVAEKLQLHIHKTLEIQLHQSGVLEEKLFSDVECTEIEKFRIQKVFYFCSFDTQSEEESLYREKSLCELKSLKTELNEGVFSYLLSPQSFQHLSSFKKIFQLLHQIKVAAVLRLDMEKNLHAWYEARILAPSVKRALEALKVELSQTPDHEKDLTEIFKNLTVSPDEIDWIRGAYAEIYAFGQKLKGVGFKSILEGVEALRLKGTHLTFSDRNLLIALGREAVRNEFGIYPYNTQIIALLGLIQYPAACKGRIAQVNTGEGKSLIIALLAFYHAVLGKTVDVVSSSRYLAMRDEEKYRSFFANYGISTSNLCTDIPTPAHFAGQIIFSTNFDLEFAVMRDYFSREPMRSVIQDGMKKTRPFEVVIVDEVDNLFIDSALNSARISIESPIREDLLYEPIYRYVVENQTVLQREQKAGTLKIFLGKNYDTIFPFPESRPSSAKGAKVTVLVESALKALLLKENEDYVVAQYGSIAGEKITIVDKESTGRLSQGCRYSKGLHEFLELKHHFPIQKENLLLSSLCHPVYFGQYQTLYGLTGTIGLEVEKQELRNMYLVDSFQVPPHRGKNREDFQPIACKDEQEYDLALFDEIQRMQKAKRPTLLLFKTIEESERFASFCQQKNCFVHLLNVRQRENESFLVAKAGSPGCVTIATNVAGRGMDIVLEKESVLNGGLHVVLAFMPQNDRVEMQARGRAGRQGQKGSSRIIVNLQQEILENKYIAFEPGSSEDLFALLKLRRDIVLFQESHTRFFRSEVEKINNQFLQKFIAFYAARRNQFAASRGAIPFDGMELKRYFAQHFYGVLDEIFENLSETVHETVMCKQYESAIATLYASVIRACSYN